MVDPEFLDATALAMVAKLTAGAPLALAHIKSLVRKGLDRTFADAFRAEGEAQVECLHSADLIEGVAAFFQKRPADFKGL